LRAVEIAEHTGLINGLHREVVMRTLPAFERCGVAGSADFAPNQSGTRIQILVGPRI
jgi:hypothetical protein